MATATDLSPYLELFACPGCRGALSLAGAGLRCGGCQQQFEIADEIPMCFWPTEGAEQGQDLSEIVKAFYEETPFPDYNDFDSVASFAEKARKGIFARMLDQHTLDFRRVRAGYPNTPSRRFS